MKMRISVFNISTALKMDTESRRNFLKHSFLGTAVMVMSGDKLFGAVSPLDTIELLQNDLFPLAKELQSNSRLYISTLLTHSRVTDEDKEFIRNGVKWLNEEAVELYKKTYTDLTSEQRQKVLKSAIEYRWGHSWIETMMTYIMEAVLGDPIYGINKNGSGWKWLNHTSGLPRPKKAVL